MIAVSILHTLIWIPSLNVGNIMLLVAATSSSLLSLPFSLYASHWTRTCQGTFLATRVFFTSSTMSVVSFCLIVGVSLVRGVVSFCSPWWDPWRASGTLSPLFVPVPIRVRLQLCASVCWSCVIFVLVCSTLLLPLLCQHSGLGVLGGVSFLLIVKLVSSKV